MATTAEQTWLPTAEEAAKNGKEFLGTYVMNDASEIFQQPHCAGYWLYGVAFDKDFGWLGYEFDESGPDYTKMDHSKAIRKWRRGEKLPERYFWIGRDFASAAYANACRKWGAWWYSNHDLPMLDELIQYTLLGEIRYG